MCQLVLSPPPPRSHCLLVLRPAPAQQPCPWIPRGFSWKPDLNFQVEHSLLRGLPSGAPSSWGLVAEEVAHEILVWKHEAPSLLPPAPLTFACLRAEKGRDAA